MKTLGKLVSRLIFGPSLEDYEARQKADFLRAIYENSIVGKLSQEKPRLSGNDESVAFQLSKILQMQIEQQLQAIEQTKRAAHDR